METSNASMLVFAASFFLTKLSEIAIIVAACKYIFKKS